ncbi:MAG: DUF3891 domain-containing protein, partial [Chloroflexota bacterium]|nr:DUF3891 domain-containing protein [Chloroflexota bacterium]
SGGTMPLTLSFVAPDRWTLDPWPITVDELRLVGEGRLLRDRYGNEIAMREALEIAPWVRWESVIAPVQ